MNYGKQKLRKTNQRADKEKYNPNERFVKNHYKNLNKNLRIFEEKVLQIPGNQTIDYWSIQNENS